MEEFGEEGAVLEEGEDDGEGERRKRIKGLEEGFEGESETVEEGGAFGGSRFGRNGIGEWLGGGFG